MLYIDLSADTSGHKSRKGYLCSMDECDFEGYKIFYHYLPRLKLQFNRDFKQYVTESVKPINNNELGKKSIYLGFALATTV